MINFENNPLIEKTVQFSLNIIEFCELLENHKKYVIAKQLLRSGTSIAYKLSQNRNQTDYFNIVNELQKLNTPSSNLLASEMKTEFIDRK